MLLFIVLLLKLITNSSTVRVTSFCGHPGLPPDGSLYQVNSGRIRFDDGEIVEYICPQNYHAFKQTKKCVSGRWIGNTAICGVPIENDILSVQVYNCSQNEDIYSTTHKLILDLALNQTENPLRFVNSFLASRINTGPITVYGSTCYLWKFTLKSSVMVPFLAMDFATQLSQRDVSNGSLNEVNSTSLQNDLLTIEPYVSPYRICRSLHKLDFINPDPYTNATFLLSGYYFRCDSTSENDHKIETKKLSKTIMVQTRTNYPRDVNLVAVFLSGHKMNSKNSWPDCGKPETVKTGVNSKESSLDVPEYTFQCNTSFVDVTTGKPSRSKTNLWYKTNCSINGLWEGIFPVCVPKIQCPGLEYLEKNKGSSVVIEAIENVYYVNNTYWVAGEHSQVNFACINPEHIVVGKLTRHCLKNGTWSNYFPKCTSYVVPESLNTVAQSPWTIIAILSALLLIFLTCVFLIVRKYVTNMRNELMKYRKQSQKQTVGSVYMDLKSNSVQYIYDDCANLRLNSRSDTQLDSSSFNRIINKNTSMCTFDCEYIELEGTQTTTASSEPLYIPIYPPL